MACLFCGGKTLEPLYEGIRDHYGIDPETHRFLRCAACGSATLDPLPSPERLAALYSADYSFKPDPAHSAMRRLLQAVEWRCFYEPGYRSRLAILRRLTGFAAGACWRSGAAAVSSSDSSARPAIRSKASRRQRPTRRMRGTAWD